MRSLVVALGCCFSSLVISVSPVPAQEQDPARPTEGIATAGSSTTTDWFPTSPVWSPRARVLPAMAYDSSRGRVVLFGGAAPSYFVPDTWEFLNDTWEWDGTAWVQRTPATHPSPGGTSYVMAHDSLRRRTVMFGTNPFIWGSAETWEWDGEEWTLRTPANSPRGRNGHAMAYDSKRGRTVLFGGSYVDRDDYIVHFLSDTWEWDGDNWTQLTPPTSPSGRMQPAMAYDSVRERVVLFGGGLSPLNDTWEWDGSVWTQRIPTTSPSPRSRHSMVFDSARGRVVMFGGYSQSRFDETWEWDGENWTQVQVATSPPARYTFGMAYDDARARSVIFGGSFYSTVFSDTWEYGCAAWFYRDDDEDGHGDPSVAVQACEAPAGYVPTGDDCDDSDPATHPGAPEICDGLDNDCNGLVDDTSACMDGDGDGVHDDRDQCAGTPAGEVVNAAGCSIPQLVPATYPWKDHGEYVSSVAAIAGEFVAQGLITDAQRSAIVSEAARSEVGRRR